MQLTAKSGKTWVLRTYIAGRRREIGLGGYPDVPLVLARERARAAKAMIRRGIDPVEQRKVAGATLLAAGTRGLQFADALDRFLATRLNEFRSEKHRRQWCAPLEFYAVPALSDMPVQDIRRGDVLRALEPIWTSRTVTASRLRARIESVLDWSTAAGYRQGDNPARWRSNLYAILQKLGKT